MAGIPTGNYSADLSKKDNSSASSSSSLTSQYRGGDYYTISGRSNTGIGLGKIIVFGVLSRDWLVKIWTRF